MGDRFAPVPPETLRAFAAANIDAVRETVRRALGHTDHVRHHGEEAEALISAGMTFVARMLEGAMAVGSVGLLDDGLLWARDRLPYDGVQPKQVLSLLELYRGVLSEQLAAEHLVQVLPYLDWMIAQQRALIEGGGQLPSAPGDEA